MKGNVKKYKILTTTVLLGILFVMYINSVTALEYWGYDTGKYATQYYASSNNDDAVLSYQTRVLFSRENSNDNWKLSELKLALIFSLNPDSPDKSENYWFTIYHWTYYIDWIKFEIKIEEWIFNRFEKEYYVTPLGGNTLGAEGCGVSESGDTSDDLLFTLYEYTAEELAGVIHPFFGLLLHTVFTVVNYLLPSGDAFDTGSTSNSDWCAYQQNPSDKVNNMGITVWFSALKDIPKSTHPYISHMITIYYTIQVKKMGYGSGFMAPWFPIGPVPAYTISRSVRIEI